MWQFQTKAKGDQQTDCKVEIKKVKTFKKRVCVL